MRTLPLESRILSTIRNEGWIGSRSCVRHPAPNSRKHTIVIILGDTGSGKTYLARIYTDGGDKMKTRTQVKCTRLLVDSSQIMQFALKPGGGVAMQLVPVTDQEIEEYKKYRGQVL